MSKRLAPQTHRIYGGATRNVAVDFTGLLDAGELLTGTPTVSDPTGELAISAVQVTSSAMQINLVSVDAGMAVAFTVERGNAPTGSYTLDITVTTSAGQIIPGAVRLLCA